MGMNQVLQRFIAEYMPLTGLVVLLNLNHCIILKHLFQQAMIIRLPGMGQNID